MKHILLILFFTGTIVSVASSQYSEQTVGAYGTYLLTLEPRAMREDLGLKGGLGGGLSYRYLTKESTWRFGLAADYTRVSGTSSIDNKDREWIDIRVAPSVDFGSFRYNFAPHIGLEIPFNRITDEGTVEDTSYMRIGLAVKAGFSIRLAWEAELNVNGAYDVVNAITRDAGEPALAFFRTTFGVSYYLTHARDPY